MNERFAHVSVEGSIYYLEKVYSNEGLLDKKYK